MNDPSARFEHFHQTLDFLLNREQYEAAAYLAHSLGVSWETHEFLEDGIRYLSPILTVIDVLNVPPDLKAALFLSRGTLKRHQSRYEDAYSDYAAGTSLTFQNHDTMVKLLSGLGEIAYRQGAYTTAAGFYQQHLEISQNATDVKRTADAMNGLGRLATIQKGMNDALDYHRNGQRLCQQSGYAEGMGWSLNAVGELERARKNHTRAVERFQESLGLFQSENNPGAAALVKQNLAFSLLATGDVRSAERLFREALNFWMQGRSVHGSALCLIGLACIFQTQQRFLEAADLLIFARLELDRAGIQLELGDCDDYERADAQSQENLTHGDCQAAVERGQHLTIQAVLGRINGQMPAPRLSPRETELLRLMQRGMTDKQIASSLVISAHTVNTHLRSIYRKLNVGNRTAAVHAALQGSLLKPSPEYTREYLI